MFGRCHLCSKAIERVVDCDMQSTLDNEQWYVPASVHGNSSALLQYTPRRDSKPIDRGGCVLGICTYFEVATSVFDFGTERTSPTLSFYLQPRLGLSVQ